MQLLPHKHLNIALLPESQILRLPVSIAICARARTDRHSARGRRRAAHKRILPVSRMDKHMGDPELEQQRPDGRRLRRHGQRRDRTDGEHPEQHLHPAQRRRAGAVADVPRDAHDAARGFPVRGRDRVRVDEL